MAFAFLVAGCSHSEPTVLERFRVEPARDQIETIQTSPASPERKAELIGRIEAERRVTAPAMPVGGRAPELTAPRPTVPERGEKR